MICGASKTSYRAENRGRTLVAVKNGTSKYLFTKPWAGKVKWGAIHSSQAVRDPVQPFIHDTPRSLPVQASAGELPKRETNPGPELVSSAI